MIRPAAIRMFTLVVVLSIIAIHTAQVLGDENLRTPYIMLDPATLPPSTAGGEPLATELLDPTQLPRLPADLGLPKVIANRNADAEQIVLKNAALSLHVTIDATGHAIIAQLRNEHTDTDLLASPSPVFNRRGSAETSSDALIVTRWDGFQYSDYAELRVQFADPKQRENVVVTWRARLFRASAQLEQQFDVTLGEDVIGQVLNTKPSLRPVMPTNAFGRGFVDGRPNLVDRHRFEIVTESDHLAFDPAEHQGLWGFVADIGGQERFADGRIALLQHPSFQTRASGRTGTFMLQPFSGPVETGFLGLRRFIQSHYAVQGEKPAMYEWNQFWLWQGGPIGVDYSVVTEQRLLDVLPRQVAMGMEEFHLDAGWQMQNQVWQLATDRFPGGWDAIRAFNRANGLAYHTWMNDAATDSPDVILDLIQKSNLNRLFMDRQITEKTVEGVAQVRAAYPGFSTSCHNSTSRSTYWSWGNVHFLSHINQIYFGEGQFWLWSNIKPEAQIEPKQDPLFPQRTEAERFFSRHDMYAGDLITRSAAYQSHWVWPFNCTSPPHCGWAWFENRPIEELKDRIYSYLASRFAYQWGEDPRMLTPEAIELHLTCTAWFKANRASLTTYQHVLGPPDGKNVDAAGHLRDGKGFIFFFNPSDKSQSIPWRDILWEPELELRDAKVALSDWSSLDAFTPLDAQTLAMPTGALEVPARGIKVIGVNLDDANTLARVRAERERIKSGA